MPDPDTTTMRSCGVCGEAYAPSRYAKDFCGRRCEARAKATCPPEVAAWLDPLAEEFARAVRLDHGYVIDIAAEGAALLARRGDLPDRYAV